MTKSAEAYRTIGEVAAEVGVPPHILRYWEGRFPQLRPVTRAGNRRYYRPEDVALVRRIAAALNHDGYTMKGVQKLLADEITPPAVATVAVDLASLRQVRDELRAALSA